MSKIKDGGPAFPAMVSINRSTGEHQPHQFGNDDFCTTGLSLRDYFAAKAMQGWLASFGPTDSPKASSVANLAYGIADAMLAARGAQ